MDADHKQAPGSLLRHILIPYPMKNILVILLLLPGVTAFAQLSFGVKAGLNYNNLHLKQSSSASSRILDDGADPNLSFHAGIFTKIPLSDKFSFLPELQYIRKGYKFTYISGHLNLNYLEMPLIFSYSPVKLVGLELGPGIAYRLAAKRHSDGHTYDLSNVFDKKFDINLNAGAHFYITEKLSVGARYSYGLISCEETFFTGDGIHGDKSREYNRNILLSAYYKIF